MPSIIEFGIKTQLVHDTHVCLGRVEELGELFF